MYTNKKFLGKYDIPYTEDKIGNEEIYLFNFLKSDAVYKRFKKLLQIFVMKMTVLNYLVHI